MVHLPIFMLTPHIGKQRTITTTTTLIVKTRYFESFIILIIGLNCITLAMSDSNKEETPTEAKIEIAFQVLYTIEMVLRVFSLGFVIN